MGRAEDATCPKCGTEEGTPDYIVFRCKKDQTSKKVRRVKDGGGRREWVREAGMRWDDWDALASRKWVRMEDTDRVDDEGRAVLERVEAFFENVHRQV